jgi:hypothetical protein
MNKRIKILLTLLVPIVTIAQNKSIPINISFLNEATAVPFTTFWTTPIHPGLQAGTEFYYKQNQHTNLYQTVSIGYIFHQNLYKGIFIKTELGYDYKLNFGLNIKTAIGIGYLHTFSTNKEYQFKNGIYESAKDKGNSRLMSSIGAGLGYRLQKDNLNSPEIFMMYNGWAEYPYSPGFIPIMTHINTQIGAKFFLNP